MTRFLRALPYILLALNILFIFGNSALSGSSSAVVSKKAEEAIEQVVGKDIENDPQETMYGKTFNNFLRKCAHVVEFFFLAVLTYICTRPIRGSSRILAVILTGVSVPLIDETIQLFTGRSSLVKDIWIDIMGYAIGCALMLIIQLISFLLKKRQGNE